MVLDNEASWITTNADANANNAILVRAGVAASEITVQRVTKASGDGTYLQLDLDNDSAQSIDAPASARGLVCLVH